MKTNVFKKIFPLLVIVAVLAVSTIYVGFARNGLGYGYGGPPVTPTSTLPQAVIQVATATPTPIPTLVPPTETSTPAGVVTGRITIEDSIVIEQEPTSVMMIPKLWGTQEMSVVDVQTNAQGELIPPIGSVGKYGSAYFCHLDYLSPEGRGLADICAKLVYLKNGDQIIVGGRSYSVTEVKNNVPASDWASQITGGVTLSTCQPGTWNGHEYTGRLVLVLTPLE